MDLEEVELLLPEAAAERWPGVLLLAFDMVVGDDLGIRTGADMVDATRQVFVTVVGGKGAGW